LNNTPRVAGVTPFSFTCAPAEKARNKGAGTNENVKGWTFHFRPQIYNCGGLLLCCSFLYPFVLFANWNLNENFFPISIFFLLKISSKVVPLFRFKKKSSIVCPIDNS